MYLSIYRHYINIAKNYGKIIHGSQIHVPSASPGEVQQHLTLSVPDSALEPPYFSSSPKPYIIAMPADSGSDCDSRSKTNVHANRCVTTGAPHMILQHILIPIPLRTEKLKNVHSTTTAAYTIPVLASQSNPPALLLHNAGYPAILPNSSHNKTHNPTDECYTS